MDILYKRLGLAEMMAVWLVIFVAATVVLAVWEKVRARIFARATRWHAGRRVGVRAGRLELQDLRFCYWPSRCWPGSPHPTWCTRHSKDSFGSRLRVLGRLEQLDQAQLEEVQKSDSSSAERSRRCQRPHHCPSFGQRFFEGFLDVSSFVAEVLGAAAFLRCAPHWRIFTRSAQSVRRTLGLFAAPELYQDLLYGIVKNLGCRRQSKCRGIFLAVNLDVRHYDSCVM